jgi:hypothetical protein
MRIHSSWLVVQELQRAALLAANHVPLSRGAPDLARHKLPARPPRQGDDVPTGQPAIWALQVRPYSYLLQPHADCLML